LEAATSFIIQCYIKQGKAASKWEGNESFLYKYTGFNNSNKVKGTLREKTKRFLLLKTTSSRRQNRKDMAACIREGEWIKIVNKKD
jgi:hypothetical protein